MNESNKMEEKIIFLDDDGNEIEMAVIEETRINNVNYILVTDDENDEEEATAYILKDVSNDEDEEAVYEMVIALRTLCIKMISKKINLDILKF